MFERKCCIDIHIVCVWGFKEIWEWTRLVLIGNLYTHVHVRGSQSLISDDHVFPNCFTIDRLSLPPGFGHVLCISQSSVGTCPFSQSLHTQRLFCLFYD